VTGRVVCCLAEPAGPWWLTLAAFDLFVIVCLVCFLLVRYFDARDARIRPLVEAADATRVAFMACAGWQRQAHHYFGHIPEDVPELVFLGDASLRAFVQLKDVWPQAHPDPEWLDMLGWVERMAGS